MKNIYLSEPPTCNYCAEPAEYDTPTIMGPWAFTCTTHHEQLGTDFGNHIIIGEMPDVDKADRGYAIREAIYDGDFDLAEELVGDGDICEWI